MNNEQSNFLELAAKYEMLKEQLKEVKVKMKSSMESIGTGTYFQDPISNCVFKIIEPEGTFISFDKVSYVRTKKQDEKRGSLSAKEAKELGFNL